MRRFVSLFIAGLFALQCTGSAFAASGAIDSKTDFANIIALSEQAVLRLSDTPVGAFMRGSYAKYAAEHAPPVFPQVVRSTDVMHKSPGLQPRLPVEPGVDVHPPRVMMPAFAAPADPRAIHRPIAPPRTPEWLHPIQRSSVQGSASPMVVNSSTPGTTGINRWWTYQEGSIPGGGTWMVNVANGNYLVQLNDMDIPNKGIDLAFRRTYNALSTHDYQNTDGSTPSNYGDGWTNTFDAHIATNTQGGLSIYDIDGARYDYTSDGNGGWNPPAGIYNRLTSDGNGNYYWTKKTGTIYYFYNPTEPSNMAALDGRLIEIYGRNHNTNITFTYAFDGGDSSTSTKLNTITARTEAGQTATLTFADFVQGSTTYRLLATLLFPDNSTKVTYTYHYGPWLWTVNLPSNSTGGPVRTQGYGWNGTHLLENVASPRYEASFVNGSPTDGAYVDFEHDTSSRAHTVFYKGFVNPSISDGSSQPTLQPGYTQAITQYLTDTFTYSSGLTTLSDTDGHQEKYSLDASGRDTQTQAWTGSIWLTSYSVWDSNSNLIATLDARSSSSTDTTYRTDYAYDTNGNTIAVAAPSVSTNQGTFRPTSLYSYSRVNYANNVSAYCGPVKVGATGYDWVNRPTSDSLCVSGTGATRYTWNTSDANEPFGYLTDTYTPLGYHHQLQYSTANQGGGDYGLPTTVLGDAITQPIDSSTPTRTPTQIFTYDTFGNIASYNSGSDTSTVHYDTLNRLTSVVDADNYTSYKYYYANGQLSKSETPYQHARGVGPTFSYDLDGNETQETVYHGGTYVSGGLPTLPATPPPTMKYYDGDDRLVEVRQSRDSSNTGEAYANAWATRYLYDLSQSGSAGPAPTIGGQTVTAHGNLFKTVELVPTTDLVTFTNITTSASNTQYNDVKGNAFDALDRPTTKYYFVINSAQTADTLQTETYSYDTTNPITPGGTNNYGALSSDCNGLQQCTYYAYDNDSKVAQTQHTASPALDRTLVYDPDARATSVTLPTWGTQTYAYDADGRTTQSVEPSGVSAHATLTYHYYADGKPSALDVSSSALSQTSLFAYAYRTDDKLETQQINQPANSLVGTTTMSFTYSAAGRFKQRSESGPGANATPSQYVYDPTYGYLSEMDYPAGKLTGIEYDPSGAPLGQVSSVLSNGWTYALSVRGELVTFTQPSALPPYPPNNLMANGVAVNTQFKTGNLGFSWSSSIDPRMGVVLGSDAMYTDGSQSTQSVGFDALGRATNDASNSYPAPSCDTCNEVDRSTSRTYDQANHVLSTSMTCSGGAACNGLYSASVSYDWGANEHPMRIGATGAYETLHWDGNTLLFTTNNAGSLDDIKIGEAGDITPLDASYKGLSFWDRNVSHEAAFCHNPTGSGGNGTPASVSQGRYVGVTHSPCAGGGGTFPTSMIWVTVGSASNVPRIGSGGLIAMPRGDGFNDGFNIVQGVRVYDSTLGGWATPDAYAGDVYDPMSQKGYVWNRGNGLSNSDPTGYDVFLGFIPDGAMGFGHTFIVTFNPNGSDAQTWSWTNLADGHEKTLGPDIFWLAGAPGQMEHGVSKGGASQTRYRGKDFFGFHFSANNMATAAMAAVFKAAKANGESYNLFSNNCAEMVKQALQAGAVYDKNLQGPADLFTMYPNQSMLALITNGYLPENISDLDTASDHINYGSAPHGEQPTGHVR